MNRDITKLTRELGDLLFSLLDPAKKAAERETQAQDLDFVQAARTELRELVPKMLRDPRCVLESTATGLFTKMSYQLRSIWVRLGAEKQKERYVRLKRDIERALLADALRSLIVELDFLLEDSRPDVDFYRNNLATAHARLIPALRAILEIVEASGADKQVGPAHASAIRVKLKSVTYGPGIHLVARALVNLPHALERQEITIARTGTARIGGRPPGGGGVRRAGVSLRAN